ncbi:MAG: WD40 repeat domain-containing protein [Candidatus Poribacteria bacterium]|nr:WD40 repeat domain-containing protein [Candidatus Poribacteria bacterium]
MKGHAAYIASLAFSPDGSTLGSGSYDGTVLLWDVSR